jgi:hypothetical protein
MKKAILGPGISVDVQRLIETRMLVQANSGGGKSYAIRKLCEITYGGAQQIIIDVEGEFHTLREQFDYILAGQKGGDCPADLKSAALLARRLLELNVSAIIDIYELGAARGRFVKLFLEAMMLAPKELWHPVLVVVDEAHMFCPEKDKSESTGAVIDLMTRGRKRGFCGVLATQRIAKLHKDAAAECNNKLIGRCGLDVDMKRAGAELGFTTREDMLSLRALKPGEFYAFGPALSDAVEVVKVGAVATPHPRAGQRAAPPTPPRDRVKKILAQLADLPHQAEEEAKSVEELRQKNRQLEMELRKARAGAKVETKVERVNVIDEKLFSRIEKLSDKLLLSQDKLAQAQQAIVSEVGSLVTLAKKHVGANTAPRMNLPPTLIPDARAIAQRVPRIGAQQLPPRKRILPEPTNGDIKLDGPMKRILGALAWFEAMNIERPALPAIAFLSDYSGADNGAFNNNRGKLRTMGLLTYPSPGSMQLTDEGRELAPAIDIPQTGKAVRDAVLAKLDGPQRRIMQPLIDAYPSEVDAEELAIAAGYSGADNGAFNNNRGRLRTLGVATYPRAGAVRAADILFPDQNSN